MFEVVKARTALPRENILMLDAWHSGNVVQTSVPGHSPQRAVAEVVAARSGKQIGVFMHFWLCDDQQGVLMRYNDAVGEQTWQEIAAQAVEHATAMGFMMDNMEIGSTTSEQVPQIESMGIFGFIPALARGFTTVQMTEEAVSAPEAVDFSVLQTSPELSVAMLMNDNVGIEKEQATNNDEPGNWQVWVKYLASF